ncbi:cysteine-rich receptor-like protein kinase [Tanacetum coccineum]
MTSGIVSKFSKPLVPLLEVVTQPFIVPIPKKTDPLRFSDYHPISLIGCVYEVIAKILAIRLAKLILSIIRSNQTAFIGGRQILDRCIVANELIHMAHIECYNLLLFKVDFEKAFDSVNWIFLFDTMRQCGFDENGLGGFGLVYLRP